MHDRWVICSYICNTQAAPREPSMQIVSIKSNISFSETFPVLDSRLVINSGQSETDTITDTTTPSVSEWRQWIATGQYYNVQDAQVEIVFPKTFFKKNRENDASALIKKNPQMRALVADEKISPPSGRILPRRPPI